MLKYIEAFLSLLIMLLLPGIGSIVAINLVFDDVDELPSIVQVIGYIFMILAQFLGSVSFWMVVSGKI